MGKYAKADSAGNCSSGGGGGPHSHTFPDVTGLQAALDAKEAVGAASAAVSNHEAASDPHTGYQLESEKGAANGYASLDAGGKVPSAQLPPSGGGALVVKLTADLAAYNQTALTNATGLSFAVTAGQYYLFEFAVLFRSAATTTGLKLSVSLPAFTRFGATAWIPIAADGAGGELQGWITASDDAVIGTGAQAANTDYMAIVRGILVPSANGTLQLRYGSEIASSAVTIRQGSYGMLWTL